MRLFSAVVALFVAMGVLAGHPVEIIFEEELRFGAEEEALEFEWLDAQLSCDFQVDNRGHIFVVDQRNVTILEFDQEGSFIRTVAQKGQGPGEFQAVADFTILPDDRAIGIDFLGGSYKANYYDKGIAFRESRSVQNLFGFMFKADFNLQIGFVQLIRFSNGGQQMSIDLTDHDLENTTNLAKSDWPPQLTNPGDPNEWVKYLGGQFKGFWDIAHRTVGFMEDGRMLQIDNKKGLVQIYSQDGKTLLKALDVGVRPRPFTEEAQDQLVEAITDLLFKQTGPGIEQIVTPAVIQRSIDFADLPKIQTPAYDAFSIADNLFGVVTEVNWATGEMHFDLIDADKGFLGRFAFPGPGVFSIFGTRLQFKNGKAYAMGWDQDNANQMIRYSYKLTGL